MSSRKGRRFSMSRVPPDKSAGIRGLLFSLGPTESGKPLQIRGSFDGAPPAWFSGIFLVLGLALLAFMLTSTFHGEQSLGRIVLGLALATLFGGSFTALGAWMIW